MLRSVILRIVFVSSFFLLALLLIFLNHNVPSERDANLYKFQMDVNISLVLYGVAILSSFVMLYFPITIYSLSDIWMFFTSLNLSEIIRVGLGYYILTIFSGYSAYRAFARDKLNNSYEKLAIILTFSYIVSIVIGLSLSHTVGLTLFNYLCVLWIFSLFCETLHHAIKGKSAINPPQHTKSAYIMASLMIVVCLILVFSSYLITFSGDPGDLSLGGDIANYVTVSNAFLKGYQFNADYIWFQIFISVASVLTGLHPIHAFVGMQFLVVLLPLSFYTLLRRVLNDRKIATVGTVITIITGGLSSIGILGLFSEYNNENVFSTLSILKTKTQNWPWLSNHFLIVATIDWSLLMLGLCFIYCFVEGKQSNRWGNLILGSVFIASTVFTHDLLGLMIFSITLLIFSILNYEYFKKALLCFVCVVVTTLMFNALSFNLFSDTIINYYLHYQVFFAGSTMFPYQWGVIALISLLVLALLMPMLVKMIGNKLKSIKNSRILTIRYISFVCTATALIIFAISLALLAINFSDLNIPGETIFPWYIYAIRFAPLLQLALLSIPIMLKLCREGRLGFWLMVSWIVSSIFVIVLNVFFSAFVTQLIVNRALMAIYFPLGALSALTLFSMNKISLPKFRFRSKEKSFQLPVRQITILILALVIALSFLSYAYSIELFYQGNLQRSMSNDEKTLYNYLENLPSEKTFLTYSYSSYNRISSLTTHKTYAYYQYGKFVTWSMEILFETGSPELVYYLLNKLGITDVILTKQDAATLASTPNSALVSMLNFFPSVFNNSYATVYSVPTYLLNESSNYILAKPVTNPDLNISSESMLYEPLSSDNLRIVGGPPTFELQNGSITQKVQGIMSPSAQYLQLYKGIAIPIALSPIARFKINGTANALYNMGFYVVGAGWYWLSHEQGLPSKFFSAPNESKEIIIDLSSILSKTSTVIYIDFVATSSDGSPVNVTWSYFDVFRQINPNQLASSAYNFAYNALTANGIPFPGVLNYNFSKLVPANVYIFSSSMANVIPANHLVSDVKTGVHAIFLYDSAAFSEDEQTLLNSLGIRQIGVASAKNARVAEEIISFSSNLFIENLTVQNSQYSNEIRGYYTTLENNTVPFIIHFAVGNGSIIFINLPRNINLDKILANITVKAIKNVIAVLPEPILSKTLKTLPLPEDLFKLGNPNLINIYNLNGLNDYIYAFSDMKLKGNISISSDYIILDKKDLLIRKLVWQDATSQEVLENVSVANLHIDGSYKIMLTTQDAIIYPQGDELPAVEATLNRLKVYLNKSAIDLTIEQNGEEKTLKASDGYVEFEFANNLTTKFVLQKPLIMLSPGSITTSWEGVFWYNGHMFTTVSEPEYWSINGTLSLEIVRSNGAILTRLLYKDNISVTADD